MSSMQKQVGEKIRMYRKFRNMSLEELATRIYKSRSILSKYELGESVFDMDVLYRIADVLEIEPAQLLEPRKAKASPDNQRYGIFSNNTLYAYMVVRDRSYRLMKNMLIFSGDKDNMASFYMHVADFDKYTDCKMLYVGQMMCHPNNAVLLMTNQADETDHAVLSTAVRLGNQSTCLGLIVLSGYATYEPGALKILLSASPIEDEPKLMVVLIISQEDITSTKRHNIFDYHLSTLDRDIFN